MNTTALVAITLLQGLPTQFPLGEAKPAVQAAPAAPATGPCATPKAAVVNWLSNLQASQYNEGRAALCAVPPQGMSARDVQKAVVRLKQVLDARGIYVRVEELPEDADYREPATSQARVVVSPLLPDIYLVKQKGRWVFSQSTLKNAGKLYSETFPLDVTRIVDSLPPWMNMPILGIAGWQLLGLALLIFIGMIARLIVTSIVTSQVTRVLDRLNIGWGRDLIRKNALPLGTLALAGVIGLGVTSLALSVGWAKLTLLAVRIIAAMSVVMLVYRFVDVIAAWMQHRADKTDTKLDDQLVPLMRRGLRVITILGGVVFVLQNLEVNVGSLLATLGIGTLAFALAAQDTVKNLFGSVTIFLDKPFQIGDWVVVEGVEGIIEEVGFRSTRIRTFYNSLVTVPNGKFTEAIVDNYGLRKFRRCSIRLGLTYDTSPDQMEAFCDGVRGIIKAHPDTRKDYYEVHFAGYGDSGLEVMLYFFFEVSSWTAELRGRHEVFLDFLRLARELKVSFAFPTRTLHIDSHAKPGEPVTQDVPSVDALRDQVSSFGPGGKSSVATGQRVHEGFYASAANPRGDVAAEGDADG